MKKHSKRVKKSKKKITFGETRRAKLKRWMKLPAKKKLEWLEEMRLKKLRQKKLRQKLREMR